MAGVGYNPIPFQKKSSLFGYFPFIRGGSACLFLYNQGVNHAMLLPEIAKVSIQLLSSPLRYPLFRSVIVDSQIWLPVMTCEVAKFYYQPAPKTSKRKFHLVL